MVRKRALIPVLLLGSTTAWAKPPTEEKTPKPLIELRSRLFEAGEEGAMKDVPRFRPLCDKDGFPLVGNAVGKSEVYQPSSFCAVVRSREHKA